VTQYKDKVEQHALLLEAEAWAKGIRSYHYHNLSSMWYEIRPEDTADGKYVRDTQYNDESIERELEDGTIVYLGEKLTGDKLINKYLKRG
tara:strand:- start:481 stop:750 length:270 start_codon:yes stop_codon:yes gene_type:complete